MWRQSTWLLGPALLLGGCLMSRVEFAEGTASAGSGGSGASSNGGSGASSNGGSESGGSAVDMQGGADGAAGDAPGAGGTMPGGSGGSGGTGAMGNCGNSAINAGEACDDGNDAPGDGCSATCALEPSFICDRAGLPCAKKPVCGLGSCTGSCGDGFWTANEECDDGNLVSSDGCTQVCSKQTGYTCSPSTGGPGQLVVSVIYRDLITEPLDGAVKHPDLKVFAGLEATEGLVESTLGDELPVYTGLCEQGNSPNCPGGNPQTSSKMAFDHWFHDTPGVNVRIDDFLVLDRVGQTQAYEFNGGAHFSPVLGRGWDALGKEALVDDVNFGFTTELRFPFVLRGNESITFTGDDDVWIFVNNQLVIDLGGMHLQQSKSVTLGQAQTEPLGMSVGEVYEFALFHAERAPTESNFKLTLTNFARSPSLCTQ